MKNIAITLGAAIAGMLLNGFLIAYSSYFVACLLYTSDAADE